MEEVMVDPRPVLVIEKEGGVFNVVMGFHVANYRNGVALVGRTSFRDPKTNDTYSTYHGAMGSVKVYSDCCEWRYIGDPHGDRMKYDFKSFDEVKKFAINKFIQIVRAHLKSEFFYAQKLTREESKQIRAHMRSGIEEMMRE